MRKWKHGTTNAHGFLYWGIRDPRLAGRSRWAEVNDQVIPRSCLAWAYSLCNFRLLPISDLCWSPKTTGNKSPYMNPCESKLWGWRSIQEGFGYGSFIGSVGTGETATMQQLDVNGLIARAARALRICNICDGCVSVCLCISDIFVFHLEFIPSR